MGTLGSLAPSTVSMLATTFIGAAVGSTVEPGGGTVVGGVTGALAGRKFIEDLIAYTVEKGLSKAATEKFVKREVSRRIGAGIGTVLGSGALEAGQMWTQDVEKRGIKKANPYTSAGLGLVSGTTELFVPSGRFFRRIIGADKFGSKLLKDTAEGFVKRASKTVGKSMTQEGLQELTQQFIQELNNTITDPSASLTDKAAISQYINNFAGGALGGLVFGAHETMTQKTISSKSRSMLNDAVQKIAPDAEVSRSEEHTSELQSH